MDGALVFWSCLILSILGFSLNIVVKQKLYKSFVVIAILMSLFPITWVTIDCYKNSSSEACVWGQSFMPLYLGFAILFAAPVSFLIYYFGKKIWHRLR